MGQGPAVVLVDGAFGSGASGLNVATASLLARRFTVHRYDRRGRGDSGDKAPYLVEREIEDLGTVIEAAGGFALVFGTSSGGNLALRAAASGVWITRLALWEPNFLVDGGRPPLPENYADHLGVWSAVTMPTLVLDGASSAWLSAGADALADVLPNGRRGTLSGRQHDVEASVLAAALIEFFEGA